MRRLFGWMAGVVSIAALARLLSRKRHEAELELPEPDPADELKAKLAASRDAEPADAAVPPEPQPEPEPDPTSLEGRRAQVHEKAQQAIDEMRGPGA